MGQGGSERSDKIVTSSWCVLALPSSQRKSGRATSCSGISFRKPGRRQRGLPVTIFRLRSQSPSQARRQSQLKEFAKRLLLLESGRKVVKTHTLTHTHSGTDVSGLRSSQGGEGLKRAEGPRSDAGQLVVVQRQQADVVQPCEAVVVDAADLVVPQHPEREKDANATVEAHSRAPLTFWCPLGAPLTASAVPPAHGTSHFGPSRSDWP